MENEKVTLNQVILEQTGLTSDFETLVKEMSEEQLAHITQDLYWSIKKGRAFTDEEGEPTHMTFEEFKALVDEAAAASDDESEEGEGTEGDDSEGDNDDSEGDNDDSEGTEGGEPEQPKEPEEPKYTPAEAASIAVEGLKQLNESGEYTTNGSFIVAEDGSSEYTIDYAKFAEDNRAIVNDYARMLGEMYRKGNVETITFEGTDYTWDKGGQLKGSNYKAGDVTLVSAVTAKFAADMTSGAGASITIVVEGQELTTTIKFENAPSTVEVA